MAITSLAFVLFLFVLYALYFLLPHRWQWCVLLAASLLFYVLASPRGIVYVLITSATVYTATRWMDAMLQRQKQYLRDNKDSLSREDKKAYKQAVNAKRKTVMVVTLLLNLAILCCFKYLGFVTEQINALLRLAGLRELKEELGLIAPLGISFYTFQSVGYLVDVYWEKLEAEKSYPKVLLFVSFFPQMTQGPISDFSQLSAELFAEHDFSYHAYRRGMWRMLWGFMKKMVLANMLAPYVRSVFTSGGSYAGLTVFLGTLMYSVQIYADFSGYMDIMCGLCEAMGIRLTENFMRPYFSKSVAEYWRRWHISLGDWFKKYVYYPIAMSNRSRELAKRTKQRFGKHIGETLPATLALLVTWFATGLWHGASWSYIVWGLINGFFIILSLWLEPLYDRGKTALRIHDDSRLWQAFQTLRTFILVTFIKTLPEVGTLGDGLRLIGSIFTAPFLPASGGLLPFVTVPLEFMVVLFMTAALFAVSLIQRRRDAREYVARLPLVLRALLVTAGFLLIMVFGIPATRGNGGFMYAQF